jgi:hypothetical protein
VSVEVENLHVDVAPGGAAAAPAGKPGTPIGASEQHWRELRGSAETMVGRTAATGFDD